MALDINKQALTAFDRMGKFVNADEAFEAWISGDLRRLLPARSLPTIPIDPHFLLQGIVKDAFRRRVDPEMRRICIETGLMHLEKFGTIGPALQNDVGGSLPCVAFAWLATVMLEAGPPKPIYSPPRLSHSA